MPDEEWRQPLRRDLHTGIVSASTDPEVRVQALFHDRRIGVTRRVTTVVTSFAAVEYVITTLDWLSSGTKLLQ